MKTIKLKYLEDIKQLVIKKHIQWKKSSKYITHSLDLAKIGKTLNIWLNPDLLIQWSE